MAEKEPKENRHPNIQIKRVPEGFEVSGDENFLQVCDVERVDRILNTTVLPIVRSNLAITLPDLFERSDSLAQKQLPNVHHIPWTALHLLVQWKIAEEKPEDPSLDRASELLGQLFEAVLQSRRELAREGQLLKFGPINQGDIH